MITLEQAIKLATQAHEGQWRHPTIIKYSQLEELIGGSYACDLQAGCFENNVYKHNNKLITKIDDSNYYYSIPYITHPLSVMDMMDTEEEKIVAVLHDVVEECKGYYLYAEHNGSAYYLTKENNNDTICLHLTKDIYTALVLLTHSKDISYSKYVIEFRKNKLATKVKIADIICNLADNPSEHAKQKYLKAIPILLKGI